MDKVKKLLKKIMDAKKRGKSLISELKKLNIKELMAIKLEILKKQIIAAALPFLGWFILGVIIIAIVFLVIYMLIGPLMDFLGSLLKGWNYLWQGTSGLVTEQDVNEVRQQLEDAGVDFEEIGYIGEELFNIQNMDLNLIRLIFTGTNEIFSDAVVQNIMSWVSVENLGSKIKEYQKKVVEKEKEINDEIDEARKQNLQSELDDINKDFNKIKDRCIYFYLASYLIVEKQTMSSKNYWTLDQGDNGGIEIDSSAGDSWWNNIWVALGNNVNVEVDSSNSDDPYYINLDKAGKMYVSQYIKDYAMPWQYPFIFHENTLSPDIGYRVADLGNKYHKLKLTVYKWPSLIIKKTTGADGSVTSKECKSDDSSLNSIKKEVTKPDGTVEQRNFFEDYTYFIKPNYIKTWYSTISYSYSYTEGVYEDTETLIPELSEIDSKTGVKTEYYYKRPNVNQIANAEVLNDSGIRDMNDILLPNPTYEDGKLSNASEVKAYYTANNTDGDADKITGRSDLKGKTVLAVATNAEIILKSVHDLYKDTEDESKVPVITEEGAEKPKYTDASGNQKDSKINYVSGIDYNEMKNNTENQINKENSTKGKLDCSEPKILRDLATYFVKNANLLNEEDVNLGAISVYLNNSTYILWPLDEGTSPSDIAGINLNNTATINCTAGTKVIAPISGDYRIEEDGSGNKLIYITKTGSAGEENPDVLTIVLGNVDISLSGETGSITVGQDIGTSKGPITFGKQDSSGQLVNPTDDLNMMKKVASSEYEWPVEGYYTITSPYGWRIHPVYDDKRFHNGIDIGTGGSNPPIKAIMGGIVTANGTVSGYGNWIIIDHENGISSLYAHMKERTPFSIGSRVVPGNIIGYVGTTGTSTGEHLHLTIFNTSGGYKNGSINPFEPGYLIKPQ